MIYAPIPGLRLSGLLAQLEIEHAIIDGSLWLRGHLLTSDSVTGSGITVSFEHAYPADDLAWAIADFIAWILTHEAMEGAALRGRSVFACDRLDLDHAASMEGEQRVAEMLARARDRKHRDSMAGRLIDDVLLHPIRSRLKPNA